MTKTTATSLALCLSFSLLTACAGPRPEQTAGTQQVCTGGQNSLTIPPTPATQAAMDALISEEKKQLDDILRGVAAGDAGAQIELGLRYANGTDVPQNGERAFRLFDAAARQGNAVGLFFLGSAFANGLGVEKNDAQAVFLWEEASRLGHPLSQYWLGFMIANGRIMGEGNWCAALPLLEAAAARDIPDASFMLGNAYDSGALGTPDYERAADWYRNASRKELNQKAQYNLRVLIERYQAKWREGDPGVAPPPKPAEQPKLKIKDSSANNVG